MQGKLEFAIGGGFVALAGFVVDYQPPVHPKEADWVEDLLHLMQRLGQEVILPVIGTQEGMAPVTEKIADLLHGHRHAVDGRLHEEHGLKRAGCWRGRDRWLCRGEGVPWPVWDCQAISLIRQGQCQGQSSCAHQQSQGRGVG